MSSHRVTRGFAWNHLYKMVEYGGMSLYSILVVRKFGPELGGNYAVYCSICTTLAILAAFAVDGVLLRYLPRIARGESQYGEKKIEGVRPFLIEMLAFRLMVTLVISILVAVALGVVPEYVPSFAASLGNLRTLWPYLMIFLFGQVGVAFSTFTLIGLLEVKWIFFASLVTRGLMLAGGVVMVFTNHLTLEGAVALFAIAPVLNAVLLLPWVHRLVEPTSSPGIGRELKQVILHLTRLIGRPSYLRVFVVLPFMLYGITTWGNDMLTTLLGRQPDFLMMRAMLGENAADIGLYEAAARIVLMTEYIFLFGLGHTLIAVFSELAHTDEEAHDGTPSRPFPRLYRARRDIAGFQSVTTAPLIFFMLAFAPLGVEAIYGPKFAGAVPMVTFGLGALAVTVLGFGGGLHVTSLVTIGKERVVFFNRLGWGIANLVANYFLIRHWGGLGAMIGTQLANSGACVTESMLAQRWIGPSFQLGRTTRIVLIASAATAASYLLTGALASQAPILARFAIGAVLTAIFTLVLYYLFRVPEAQKVIGRLKALMATQ
ncbi:MAG: oligosaccharide flippase family protein [Bacteroidota bacterium]|nr:oligosaccharide flippase family protein [Bacteroidota bacterium]MDP4233945.1 oligosaccharide flippase family protein [Bacteroidota bacterium]MDP4242804.1 oligosaccharide flippase family protein [Bacteroidota bacterium]MDP4288518.1 oligosaccharide flippase family protein [Bacteroidota bacterium]